MTYHKYGTIPCVFVRFFVFLCVFIIIIIFQEVQICTKKKDVNTEPYMT